jgi:hypothetical protein
MQTALPATHQCHISPILLHFIRLVYQKYPFTSDYKIQGAKPGAEGYELNLLSKTDK